MFIVYYMTCVYVFMRRHVYNAYDVCKVCNVNDVYNVYHVYDVSISCI